MWSIRDLHIRIHNIPGSRTDKIKKKWHWGMGNAGKAGQTCPFKGLGEGASVTLPQKWRCRLSEHLARIWRNWNAQVRSFSHADHPRTCRRARKWCLESKLRTAENQSERMLPRVRREYGDPLILLTLTRKATGKNSKSRRKETPIQRRERLDRLRKKNRRLRRDERAAVLSSIAYMNQLLTPWRPRLVPSRRRLHPALRRTKRTQLRNITELLLFVPSRQCLLPLIPAVRVATQTSTLLREVPILRRTTLLKAFATSRATHL